ncbi:unnamed protein product [Nesidiocoris tenuis]|uniref:Uncharacterized protein n=1 Tax=Nesidiocoris tenuis TaxID=355587 RepID=A0A6H5G699_9HEMI|nr:unnamed protein product [Nesidiocoris tenuis]
MEAFYEVLVQNFSSSIRRCVPHSVAECAGAASPSVAEHALTRTRGQHRPTNDTTIRVKRHVADSFRPTDRRIFPLRQFQFRGRRFNSKSKLKYWNRPKIENRNGASE